jgi:hypothetical protein
VLDSNAAATAPAADSHTGRRGSSALAARRRLLIIAPTLAGLLAVAGALFDPAVDQEGAPLFTAYAAEVDAVQWKSLSYHFSYAFWGLAALMLAGAVGRRGGWLANVAGLLAFLGISTLPGFLLADFYDSAIGRLFGADGALRVEDAMGEMWGLTVMSLTGVAGFLLCLPVAAFAAWRGRLIAWWAPVGVLLGVGGGFLVLGANPLGAAVLTAGCAVLSVALARSTLLRERAPS